MQAEYVFRVDASTWMGTGHVMRCLSLAESLPVERSKVLFLCRPHAGHSMDAIRSRGFAVLEMSPVRANESDWLGVNWALEAKDTIDALVKHPPTWLIVDHYGWHASLERQAIKWVSRLLVIDDLANRNHDCDVLLDQNLGRVKSDYLGLIPEYTLPLMGVQYALLRRDYLENRSRALSRRLKESSLATVLLNLGGSDPHDYTSRILKVLATLPQYDSVDVQVVVGKAYPYLDLLSKQINTLNAERSGKVELWVNIADMAEKMIAADLAIGAGGSTAWERCALGLPSIAVQIADNQAVVLNGLQEAGASVIIPDPEKIELQLPHLLLKCLDAKFRHAISLAASKLVDCRGCERVAAVIEKYGHRLRPLQLEDLEWILAWRNHPHIRSKMLNQHRIEYPEHLQWFKRTQEQGARVLLVYESAGLPMGYLNLSKPNALGESEWGFYTNPDAPRGTGMAMARLALYHAFVVLGADCLIGDVMPTNTASINYHRRLGFKSQGDNDANPPGLIRYHLTRAAWSNIEQE